jgi:hypothetical protein
VVFVEFVVFAHFRHATVVLKEGSGDIRELERVINQKTHLCEIARKS